MKKSELERKVLAALREVAPEADLSDLDPDRNFRDQIELDSLDFLQLALRLEERTGRQIPESDYPKLSSLSGCIQYLASPPPHRR
jgi:acyl carrier protein